MGLQIGQGNSKQKIINMNYSKELGNFSEEKAAEYLILNGYEILGRNFVNRLGELDIIASERTLNKPELIIVEVRCRIIGEIQSPLDSVGTKKIKQLVRTARLLVEEANWKYFWRIDVIGVTIKSKVTIQELQTKKNIEIEIEHVKDITAGMNIFN